MAFVEILWVVITTGKRANGEGSVYRQKNGLWAAAVTIGRNAGTGKIVRKYVYGKSQQEAKDKKEALLEQVKGGIAYFDADKLTVGEWILKWLTVYAKNRVRQNTYESYVSVVTNHIIPVLGSIRLQKLQSNNIQSMINDIAEKHCRSAAYTFTVLRMALKQALREELIYRDLTLAVSPPAKTKKEVRQLTPDEWKRLFATAKKTDLYMQVLLVWATGMRREEILGLRWSDVNMKTSTLAIANTAILQLNNDQHVTRSTHTPGCNGKGLQERYRE